MKNFNLAEGIPVGLEALKKYGIAGQTDKAMEEIFELVLELHKFKEDRLHPKFRLVDEIADCLVVLMQLSLVHGWEDVIERYQFKLTRLERRMSGQGAFQKIFPAPVP